MAGEGRESKKDNDLFYTCSLIDYIARKTKNTRADVVNKLGRQRIDKIYDLADVYHCDNIDRVSDDFIEEAGIQEGKFDNGQIVRWKRIEKNLLDSKRLKAEKPEIYNQYTSVNAYRTLSIAS